MVQERLYEIVNALVDYATAGAERRDVIAYLIKDVGVEPGELIDYFLFDKKEVEDNRNIVIKGLELILLLLIIMLFCSGCGKEEELNHESQPAVITYHEHLIETTPPDVTVIASEEDTIVMGEKATKYSCYGSISIDEDSIRINDGSVSVKAEFKSIPVRFNEEVLTNENMDHFLECLAEEEKEITVNPVDEHKTVYTFREENTLTLTDGELTELILKEPGDTMIEIYGVLLGSYVSDLNKMHKFEFPENSRDINEISFDDDDMRLTLCIDTDALVIKEISLTKIDKNNQ